MNKGQSSRLTRQQEEGKGPLSIFHEEAAVHDIKVSQASLAAMQRLEGEFPHLEFRYRQYLEKKEINAALQRIDQYLGQTLFVENARIKPDGGIIEVKDGSGNWRVVLVSEAKYQGKDIENIKKGIMVGKNKNQDTMAAGNAIERAYKNISEIANFMLAEEYFPYVLFLEGSNFLTQNVTVTRPDGREVTLAYNSGDLNRLDRLTASNYGMPINTNLCENRLIQARGARVMLQAASIYVKGDGGRWQGDEMIEVMLDVSRTSLKMLKGDL